VTNKIEISRELASRAIRCIEHGTETMGEATSIADELRVMLAAPVVERQVEPVAWLSEIELNSLRDKGAGFVWASPKEESPCRAPLYDHAAIEQLTQEMLADEQAFEGLVKDNDLLRAKLDAPSSPVAVVLPERMTWDGLRATACNIRGEGWNACLDKVKELNTL
jgi:hypothetical protein